MAEWEEKLGSILQNPEAMGKIMELARSLEGAPAAAESAPDPPAGAGPAGIPEGLDPRLLELGLRALSAGRAGEDKRTALLEALRPFVKEERYAKLDKALRIARLSRAARTALEGWKGGGEVV